MARELEIKAVVPDVELLRSRLRKAGAESGFRGVMTDRRYDRSGELAGRDEVLRIRSYHHPGGRTEAILGWKGPMRRAAGGYKEREELETTVTGGAPPDAILGALGYRVVHTVDRLVEYWTLHGATVRIEEYPRMDVLVEVEGVPEAMERAIEAMAIRRDAFSDGSLTDFIRQYERSGERAAVSIESFHGRPPSWPSS